MFYQHFLLALSTVFYIVSTSSAQLIEDFNYPTWEAQSAWVGNPESFTLKDGLLQSKGPSISNSKIYLSTPVPIANNANWQFTIDLKFNPTATTFVRIYLGSNEQDFTKPLNGYFLQIGQANEDYIKVYRQTNLEEKEIFVSSYSLGSSNIKATVSIQRDDEGLWKVQTSNGTGTPIIEESFVDNAFMESNWFGLYCQYSTASRNTLYFFDNITINAPQEKATRPIRYKDLMITEVMPDPSPSKGLPEREFIEIYNRSKDTLNLGGIEISDSSSKATLHRKELYPYSYLIICDIDDTSYFKGNVFGCKNLPSLNNASDHIKLVSPEKQLIDEIQYTTQYYHDQEKSSGGWSLELKNLEEPCLLIDNWAASQDLSGGTPGLPNSILSSQKIEFKLQPVVDVSSIKLSSNKVIDTSGHNLLSLQSIPPLELRETKTYANKNSIICTLDSAPKRNTFYTIKIQPLKDCLNQPLSDAVLQATFFMPDTALAGDVVINEILFNPKPGGTDFVEVYNKSNKYLDLANWSLSGDTTKTKYSINNDQYLIYPYSYLVFTADKNSLKNYYPKSIKENILQTALPPLNDDLGSIYLIDNKGRLIDRMDYNDQMHHSLVKETEGVSLEKINPNAPSLSPYSWHSASSTSDYATPGYENSQSIVDGNSSHFSIEPHVFSPNQDGYNDFAVIKYAFDNSGYVGSLNVYDANGRHIKTIANNFLLSTEGIFQWDGTNKDHHMANPGQYILVFSSYHISGDVKDFKEVVVLGF